MSTTTDQNAHQDFGSPAAVFLQRSPGDRLESLHASSGLPGRFAAAGVEIGISDPVDGVRAVTIAANTPISRVVVRWNAPVPPGSLVLGDALERSYGDLQWRHLQPERPLHWYGAAFDPDSKRSTVFGVRTGAAALCSWSVDDRGVSLWLDVRNGGQAVELRDRTLLAAEAVLFGVDGDPWDAVTLLIERLAPARIRDVGPIVGSNNWYYAYGTFDRAAVLRDARTIVEYADGHRVAPFCVVDDGWNPLSVPSGGPWDEGIPAVGDPGELADGIREAGARPGIWFRPLLSRTPAPGARFADESGWTLDPSSPAVLDRVAEDVARFADWGYELIKHDFSTFDALGGFGPDLLGNGPSGPGFADTSRTTAEILTAFYEKLRGAADVVLIGCNTIGHLAAGLVDIQRIGDDISGVEWDRTRRMGVNCLAYRLPQHGRFYAVDADCVPATTTTPWHRNRDFLDLLARSGTPLFLSVDPAARNDEVDADIRAAVALSLDGGEPDLRPVDWLHATTPSHWRSAAASRSYDWSAPWGASIFTAHGPGRGDCD